MAFPEVRVRCPEQKHRDRRFFGSYIMAGKTAMDIGDGENERGLARQHGKPQRLLTRSGGCFIQTTMAAPEGRER